MSKCNSGDGGAAAGLGIEMGLGFGCYVSVDELMISYVPSLGLVGGRPSVPPRAKLKIDRSVNGRCAAHCAGCQRSRDTQRHQLVRFGCPSKCQVEGDLRSS